MSAQHPPKAQAAPSPSTSPSGLVERLLRGEVRALARLLSLVEDRGPGYERVLDAVFPHAQRADAYRLGITGPPGAGKSTLVDRLVRRFRREGCRVGILACDPTSPFTGGAVLGDRVRMQSLRDDEGVFIRSLATRGSLGGLAAVAHEAALLVEAAGYDVVVFETIGVGQVEVDVVEAADTVVVVLTPQSGDAVQALKAGLMEIADVFVVNKADQGGADRAVQALQLALRPLDDQDEEGKKAWRPPILKLSATRDEGVEALRAAIEAHRAFIGAEGLKAQKQKARVEALLRRVVEEGLRQALWGDRGALKARWEEALQQVLQGARGPFEAAEVLLRELLKARLEVP